MDEAGARVSAEEEQLCEGEKFMPEGNGTGPFGQGPGSGRGMRGGGQRSGQGAGSSDWLVSLVGTVVLALGSIVFRALTRKLKASPEKDAKTEDEEKPTN